MTYYSDLIKIEETQGKATRESIERLLAGVESCDPIIREGCYEMLDGWLKVQERNKRVYSELKEYVFTFKPINGGTK